MSATNFSSVLKSLEIDSARVEALSEPDLCELIGFIEYDSRLQAMPCDGFGSDNTGGMHRAEDPRAWRSTPAVRPLADASCME